MSKKVIVYGASGFIGSGLADLLNREGYEVIGVSRLATGNQKAISKWVKPNDVDFKNVEAVVNLAGSPIDQRWNKKRKQEFHQSRVGITEQLIAKIAALPEDERPKVLVNGSAVGYYGDGHDAVLTENSKKGHGYLADLCDAWETAANKAELLCVRTITLRTGVVLGKEGRAFQKLLTVFQFGIGGRLGSGKQWMPWIHVDDLRSAIVFCLGETSISGPVNASAPEPERNADFTRKLAKALHRWEFFPVPAFALKIILGGFGAFLLQGQRALPEKLNSTGFRFKYPKLEDALRHLLS